MQVWAQLQSPPLSPIRQEMTDMDDAIRQVLLSQGRLPIDISALGAESDLYQAGLTSHASVNVMLALEDAFDVEFPDAMLRKTTFESIASIREALTELGASAPVA